MASLSHPDQWVDLYADALYAYALKMIPIPSEAENLTQETFLAALKSANSFKGSSSEKTWFIGILRHKIHDYLRNKYKEAPASVSTLEEGEIDSFFDHQTNRLKADPSDWAFQPDRLLENQQFWEIFENCLANIPAKSAHAFRLSELEELDSKDICKVLNLTPTNLWTLLHRARVQLRQCLQTNWFVKE